jgi:hypothetical protein
MPHLPLAEQAYRLVAFSAFAIFMLALGGVSIPIMLSRKDPQPRS